MQLTQNSRIYALIVSACAIFSLLSITFGLFPYLGLSISFITFALLAYYLKKDKTPLSKAFFAITLILSIALSIRSEISVTMLNILAIFYFGSLFVLTKKDGPGSIFSIILAPLVLFLQSAFLRSEYHLEFKEPIAYKKKRENIFNTIAVSFITLVVLAVILPLLASANPYFEKLLLRIAEVVGLSNIKISEVVFKWIVRIVFFIGTAFLIPRVATFMGKKESFKISHQMGINLLIPKTAVFVVLSVFFVTQLKLYFSSKETLNALGYTYSNYANEVFTQLSAVAVIVLALLYADKEKKKYNQKIALALLVEGIFLAFMAYKSVYEYSSAWGFTYKRLYGFAVATWILGIFTIYLYAFLKNMEKKFFLAKSAVYTGIILILINIANFDYLIYHYRRATTGSGVDLQYLSRLSPDSLSYKSQLNAIVKTTGPVTESEKIEAESNGLWILLYKIDYLQKKYKNPDIRGFNLLEYSQYKDIKDIDSKTIRERFTPTNTVQ